MADVEGISHSGICAVDLPESEKFYMNLLGAHFSNRSGFYLEKVIRGRSLNTVVVLADYLYALMVPDRKIPLPPKDQLTGHSPFRHAFAVSRERFGEIQERLTDANVKFDGPVAHPEKGPLGESIYLQDPGGNFIEFCWRRDDYTQYNPVTLSGRWSE